MRFLPLNTLVEANFITECGMECPALYCVECERILLELSIIVEDMVEAAEICNACPRN